MRTTRTAGALALTGLSLTLLACGGGGGSDALKRADLNKKLSPICAKAEKDGNAVKPPTNVKVAKDAAAYFDKIVPIYDSETASINKLKADDEAKDDFDAFKKAQTDAGALLHKIKDKADKSDASGLADLAKIGPAGDKVTAAAKKLGATECAK